MTRLGLPAGENFFSSHAFVRAEASKMSDGCCDEAKSRWNEDAKEHLERRQAIARGAPGCLLFR